MGIWVFLSSDSYASSSFYNIIFQKLWIGNQKDTSWVDLWRKWKYSWNILGNILGNILDQSSSKVEEYFKLKFQLEQTTEKNNKHQNLSLSNRWREIKKLLHRRVEEKIKANCQNPTLRYLNNHYLVAELVAQHVIDELFKTEKKSWQWWLMNDWNSEDRKFKTRHKSLQISK